MSRWHAGRPFSSMFPVRSRLSGGVLTLTLPALMLVFVACNNGPSVQGSGTLLTENFAASGFDELQVSHGFTVEVVRGEEFEVAVTIDDNVLEYLVVLDRDGVLEIGLNRAISVFGDATLEAWVTLPELRGLTLRGAAHVNLEGFDSVEALTVSASGASSATGALITEDATFDLSGASRVELRGRADTVTIEASGASRLELADFTIDDLSSVQLSGASEADVTVTGSLTEADLSGASGLTYGGEPVLGRVETSGASTIESR